MEEDQRSTTTISYQNLYYEETSYTIMAKNGLSITSALIDYLYSFKYAQRLWQFLELSFLY